MDKKKAAAMAAVTTAAAASMVTGTLFDSPAELLNQPEPDDIVEFMEGDEEGTEEETKRSAPAARLRGWILSLPEAVRMLVVVPMWIVGWVLLNAVSVFWSGAGPMLGRVVDWLCLALVMLVIFAAGVKTALPHVPLKQILRPRNIVFILVVTLVLGLADLALPTVWQNYNAASRLVWRIGATCLLAFVCSMALSRHGTVTIEVPRELTQDEVRQQALELADTVHDPKYWQ